ncbi:glutathione S-transferase [Novosphingobium kunmingense]|uniref:Glutathione S-transferase n=1 Tax=Novosphingobium kunmingense TaxID=1211806 RepID=A0A2N0I3P6_9SPHN|nr:glutathione S-transferase family protein [Novosphingobium kunmingense]PKB25807.1 glutathione S-transferase [Novosphingobium kunmingense]
MAEYTFFTNPMSRGQIARWALHEVEAGYDQVIVDFAQKQPAFLAVNPMGKVPTLVHHSTTGDKVVTECAAICVYLGEAHPEAGLGPSADESAAYYRWLFFAAGPVEQAVMVRSMGWQLPVEREGMAGWGNYERTMATLESHFEGNNYVCGNRFTMADVYVGSQVDWGLTFGSIPPNEAFVAYAERLQARDAYKAAKAIDNALIEASRK